MKNYLLSILALSLSMIAQSSCFAMIKEKSILERVQDVVTDRRCALKSIYKSLIVLISSNDFANLKFLLHDDMVTKNENLCFKHILFLKYLAQAFSRSPEEYSIEKLNIRLNCHRSAVKNASSELKNWQKGYTYIDELLTTTFKNENQQTMVCLGELLVQLNAHSFITIEDFTRIKQNFGAFSLEHKSFVLHCETMKHIQNDACSFLFNDVLYRLYSIILPKISKQEFELQSAQYAQALVDQKILSVKPFPSNGKKVEDRRVLTILHVCENALALQLIMHPLTPTNDIIGMLIKLSLLNGNFNERASILVGLAEGLRDGFDWQKTFPISRKADVFFQQCRNVLDGKRVDNTSSLSHLDVGLNREKLTTLMKAISAGEEAPRESQKRVFEKISADEKTEKEETSTLKSRRLNQLENGQSVPFSMKTIFQTLDLFDEQEVMRKLQLFLRLENSIVEDSQRLQEQDKRLNDLNSELAHTQVMHRQLVTDLSYAIVNEDEQMKLLANRQQQLEKLNLYKKRYEEELRDKRANIEFAQCLYKQQEEKALSNTALQGKLLKDAQAMVNQFDDQTK